MKPYGIVSDLHCHNWSAHASINADGVNNRLRYTLDELERAADAVLAAGGNRMVIAGDLFHQRGAIHPSVFNPTKDAIDRIIDKGIVFDAIPGNHDLASKDTTELGNAFQSFAGPSFVIRSRSQALLNSFAFVPWCSSVDELRRQVEDLTKSIPASTFDLFIHAGINGVLAGMPDHGLDAAEVAGWGFRRVFAGHYHNHKVMEGGKVISIGATTHQNWGDIGTKAGFLIVHEDKVVYQASHAPNFVEINEDTDQDDIPLLVDGNYVRIRGLKVTDSEVKALRDELHSYGCRGVTFQVVREAVTARAGSVSRGLTIEQSVDKFIDDMSAPDPLKIKSICNDILVGVRAKAA